jgi:TPR repeat protein
MKKHWLILIGTILSLVLTCAANAGPFEESLEAFKTGNKAEGYRLTRAAAEQGYAAAQFVLGQFFSNGDGVEQNSKEAVNWYRRAAEQGDDAAQEALASAYFFARGVPQDYIEAHTWANLAVANAPDEVARNSHVSLLESIAEKLTPEQVVEAQRLARQWKPKPER